VKPAAGVARSYAKALFELAHERGQLDRIAREVGTLADVFRAEPGLRAFFARPWIAPAAKRTAAVELGTRLEVSPLARDFLALVAAQGRAEYLDAIVTAFHEREDEAAGRARARVRSAVALSAGDRAALAGRLGGALGGKQVALDEVVDRELLGGFVAEVGTLLVDGSLDGQLQRLRERLARG
jgi:F-type H+-transporting ATPase subunit delta